MVKPRFKAAFVDLSGTLHVADQPIPGAAEACRKLRQSGVKVKFLTNTTKISSSALLSQLRSIGFDESAIPLGTKSIMTSAVAARDLMVRRGLRPMCLVEDELMEDLRDGIDMNDPNCVLVGLAPSKFHYDKLNDAFRLLLRITEQRKKGQSTDLEQSPLIAIHRAKYYRDSDGDLSLGPGPFVCALEEASGFKAEVVGKPSKAFFDSALTSLGVEDASEAVMVGDDALQDVGGALSAGLGGAILVKSGKYIEGDENRIPETKPTLVVESIVEAVEYICGGT